MEDVGMGVAAGFNVDVNYTGNMTAAFFETK